MQGLKVRSRNSYLLNINPDCEQGDFRTTFPYLAALAGREGRPLASGVRTPQRKLLVWQLQLIKPAPRHCHGFQPPAHQERISSSARSYLAAEAIIAQGANTRPTGLTPLSPKPLWSLNWLVKLPFREYPVSKQATPQFIPFRLQSGESSIAPLCSHE